MRPRLIAAENIKANIICTHYDVASMRPRLIAAENLAWSPTSRRGTNSFNEAAAHRRGKHEMGAAKHGGLGGFNEAAAHRRGKRSGRLMTDEEKKASMRPRLIAAENNVFKRTGGRTTRASMRPRLIAAENAMFSCRASSRAPSFNEAAAHRRGKPEPCSLCCSRGRGFNEAAAHRRGKPLRRRGVEQFANASMRPRLIAAENHAVGLIDANLVTASMRPRLIAAENS